MAVYYVGGIFVERTAIAELNKQLNVEVKVGSINLNGLKTFPRLSLELRDIRIQESMPHFNRELLKAQKLVVVFNPIKLFKGQNQIERIELIGGWANMYKGKNGSVNFAVLKPSLESNNEAEAGLNLDLKKVILQRFRLIYEDEVAEKQINFKAEKVKLAGKFDNDKFELKVDGGGFLSELINNKTGYIMGKFIETDLDIDVNNTIGSYKIKKGTIRINDLEIDAQGSILMVGDNPDFDVQLHGQNIDIQSVFSLLPNEMAYKLKGLSSSGKINLDGTIKGIFKEEKLPELDVRFGFEKVKLYWNEKNFDCRNLDLVGKISNKNALHKTQLDVNLTDLSTKKSSVKGTLKINDISKPNIQFVGKGWIDAKDFEGFVSNNGSISGKILFNLDGNLPYSEATETMDYAKSTMVGDIDFKNFNYSIDKWQLLKDVAASARISGNNLTQTKIDGNIWNSDVNYEGSIENWQGFTFQNQRLKLVGSLKSDYLDLNFSNPNNGVSADTTPSEINTDLGVDFNLKIDAKKLVWEKLNISQLTGSIDWDATAIKMTNTNFEAWHGKNSLDAFITKIAGGYEVKSFSESERVKVEELMATFDNFGQTEFTPEIVQGTLTAKVDFYGEFDNYFEALEDKILSRIELLIEDGRLVNYEPMEELSSFVELNDLRDIRFEQLSNVLEIRNRMISIPKMTINNNAMNVEIGGTHNFDNYMDYHLKIKVADLLADKSGWVKKKQEKQLESEKNGGLSAYILMTGTPDDLKIRYDRKAVTKAIKEEAKNETKTFWQDLKKDVKGQNTPVLQNAQKTQWDE
ncbi:MAG: hypothetical protein H6607_01930 [Flavobacteriales bacterium]|nr:hypothetical protein [Flavobacteriales bacterium]